MTDAVAATTTARPVAEPPPKPRFRGRLHQVAAIVSIPAGLAFFRQLPAGVPGAYRLFANLLGLKASD